jgi:hypothetical protein
VVQGTNAVPEQANTWTATALPFELAAKTLAASAHVPLVFVKLKLTALFAFV